MTVGYQYGRFIFLYIFVSFMRTHGDGGCMVLVLAGRTPMDPYGLWRRQGRPSCGPGETYQHPRKFRRVWSRVLSELYVEAKGVTCFTSGKASFHPRGQPIRVNNKRGRVVEASWRNKKVKRKWAKKEKREIEWVGVSRQVWRTDTDTLQGDLHAGMRKRVEH